MKTLTKKQLQYVSVPSRGMRYLNKRVLENIIYDIGCFRPLSGNEVSEQKIYLLHG